MEKTMVGDFINKMKTTFGILIYIKQLSSMNAHKNRCQEKLFDYVKACNSKKPC